jgi:hypothetical protein
MTPVPERRPARPKPRGRCHFCGRRTAVRLPFTDGTHKFVCRVCRERADNDAAQEDEEGAALSS